MTSSAKKLDELSEVLRKGGHNDMEKMIASLRNIEPPVGALNMLAKFYDNSADDELKLLISGFFNDIKELSSRPEIIEALAGAYSQATKAMLAASCWQSGLDYSGHAVAITHVYAEGDYYTSLECFTVLETCSPLIAEPDRTQIISLLQRDSENEDDAKKVLTGELISILKEGGDF